MIHILMFPRYYLDCYLESPLCDVNGYTLYIAFSGARKNKGEARRRKAPHTKPLFLFLFRFTVVFRCALWMRLSYSMQSCYLSMLVSPQTFIAYGYFFILELFFFKREKGCKASAKNLSLSRCFFFKYPAVILLLVISTKLRRN